MVVVEALGAGARPHVKNTCHHSGSRSGQGQGPAEAHGRDRTNQSKSIGVSIWIPVGTGTRCEPTASAAFVPAEAAGQMLRLGYS